MSRYRSSSVHRPASMYQRLVNEDDPNDHFLENDRDNIRLKNLRKEKKHVDEQHRPFCENKHIDFIQHIIKPNETLQGIALRYECSVSKLRLFNHLMTDQEFHGLSILKIPVLKNSVLKELNQTPSQEQFVNNLIDLSDLTNGSSQNVVPPKTNVINLGISNYLNKNGSEDYRKFLANLGDDLKEIRESTLIKYMESSSTSSSETETNYRTSSPSSAFLFCDLSEFVIVFVLLIVLCLLVAFFFYEHHPGFSNHTNHLHHSDHKNHL